MNAPPPKWVWDKLIGQTVSLVGFGPYVCHLSFDGKDRLSFSASFLFQASDEAEQTESIRFPVSHSNLMKIAGASVREILCEADGTLILKFDSGSVLTIYADDPMYEAYTLLVEGAEYVV